jgi:transcriptional regulator with XRE-family HTH domain|nr:helix-turn-helix transcriptional regulator [uncultured Schaedlerella sp.]
MAIGEQIKTLRKKIGYTQKQLAEKCGMAEITIRQYELNKREPRQETIEKIATALGVDPFSLYSFEMASDALEKRMNLKENMLLDNYRQLNTSGQQKADNYVEDLTKIPEYQKEE